MDNKQSLELGQKINQWEINEFLGYGRIMEAYEVQEHPNPRKRTLLIQRNDLEKRIRRKVGKNMNQNIKILKTFNHPHVSEVFASGEFNERVWYVREFGRYTLEDFLKKRKEIKFHEAKKLMIDYLKGIEEIHSKNHIHGDITPKNLMVSSGGKGFVVDMEFNYFDDSESNELKNSLSRTNEGDNKILFNMGFSSPEQKGETNYKITHKTDLYSLMKVSSMILVGRQLEVDEKLTDIRKEVPKKLERIINKNLRLNPEDRHENAYEIRKELEKINHGSLMSLLHSTRNFISDLHFFYKAIALGIPIAAGFLATSPLCNKPSEKQEPKIEIVQQIPEQEIQKPEYIPEKNIEIIPEIIPEKNIEITPPEIEKPAPEPEIIPEVIPEQRKETYHPEETIVEVKENQSKLEKELQETEEIEKQEYTKKPKIIPQPKSEKAYVPEIGFFSDEDYFRLRGKIMDMKRELQVEKEKYIKEYELEKKILKTNNEKENSLEKGLNYPSEKYVSLSLFYAKINPIDYEQKIELDKFGFNLEIPLCSWMEVAGSFGLYHDKDKSESPIGNLSSTYRKLEIIETLNFNYINNDWIKLYLGAGIGQSVSRVDITGVIGSTKVDETERSKTSFGTVKKGVVIKLTEDIGIQSWFNYIRYRERKNQNTKSAGELGVGLNFNF